MIKLTDLLNEIGEASRAFKTQENDYGQRILYTINDENFPIDNFNISITLGDKDDILQSKPDNVEIPRFKMSKNRGDAVRVDFGIIEDNQWFFPVINKGYLFGIMGTVVNSIKQVIENHKSIKYLLFIPAQKIKSTKNIITNKKFKIKNKPSPQVDTQISDNGSQRENLYLAYIKKQLPNSILTKEDGFNVIQIRNDY